MKETERNVKKFVVISSRFDPINAVAQFGPITEQYLRWSSMATRDNGRSANQLCPKSVGKTLPPELCNSIMFAVVRSSLKLFAIYVAHRSKNDFYYGRIVIYTGTQHLQRVSRMG